VAFDIKINIDSIAEKQSYPVFSIQFVAQLLQAYSHGWNQFKQSDSCIFRLCKVQRQH